MKTYIVDRIEENTVLLEDDCRVIHQIPRSELPEKIAEGQVLMRDANGWKSDKSEEEKRHKSVKRKLDTLFGRKERT